MKSDRAKLRIVGVLFLSAFLAYGIGMVMVTGIIDATNPVVELTFKRAQFITGALLMLLNSAIVASIGLLLFPVLVRFNRGIAWAYLATRAFEAVALAAGVMSLLLLVTSENLMTQAAIMTANGDNFFAYQIGMAVLGFGSLFFCALLYHDRMVPRFLAAWGFVGYTIFFAGAVLEIAGLRYGIMLSIPGGFFEIAFGIWLVAKGFDNTRLTVQPNASLKPTPLRGAAELGH
jgi:hypothetical protein